MVLWEVGKSDVFMGIDWFVWGGWCYVRCVGVGYLVVGCCGVSGVGVGLLVLCCVFVVGLVLCVGVGCV